MSDEIAATVGPITVAWTRTACVADEIGWRQCPCDSCQLEAMEEARCR